MKRKVAGTHRTPKARGISRLQDEIGRLKEDLRDKGTTIRELEAHGLEIEGRLSEKRREVEAVEKELQVFAYSMGHQLRAPVRHMEAFVERLCEMASDAKLSIEFQTMLETSRDSAKEMRRLIDSLLAYSRICWTEFKREIVSMDAVASEIQREFSGAVGDREIKWEVSELPSVEGDLFALTHVLRLLVDNALKFTRTREVSRVEIGCERKAAEYVFFVRDNGVGFDMRLAYKLFGVFQRVHRGSDYEGEGIGLAIVNKIIQRHGGSTWAEAEIDRWAKICFTLPALRSGKEHAR